MVLVSEKKKRKLQPKIAKYPRIPSPRIFGTKNSKYFVCPSPYLQPVTCTCTQLCECNFHSFMTDFAKRAFECVAGSVAGDVGRLPFAYPWWRATALATPLSPPSGRIYLLPDSSTPAQAGEQPRHIPKNGMASVSSSTSIPFLRAIRTASFFSTVISKFFRRCAPLQFCYAAG